MRRDRFRKKIQQLKDFLVPTKKPNRLVKDWTNYAEKDGREYWSYHELPLDADRYCILGGAIALMGEGEVFERLDAFLDHVEFDPILSHSPRQVRAFLDKAAELA